jgi:hypothetical protein
VGVKIFMSKSQIRHNERIEYTPARWACVRRFTYGCAPLKKGVFA